MSKPSQQKFTSTPRQKKHRRDMSRRDRFMCKTVETPLTRTRTTKTDANQTDDDEARISTGAHYFVTHFAYANSDAAAKSVYGSQKKQAAKAGRSPRTIRRWRAQAEKAGLIETERAKPVRGPDGRWTRRWTNRYHFIVPEPKRYAPRKPRSHLADNDGRYNHILKNVDINLRPKIPNFSESHPLEGEPEPFSVPPPGGFAKLRESLLGNR